MIEAKYSSEESDICCRRTTYIKNYNKKRAFFSDPQIETVKEFQT
tara:strand:- start:553 stop:687 length:135 start_codon:yes stop_codon:yes gene_type:complete